MGVLDHLSMGPVSSPTEPPDQSGDSGTFFDGARLIFQTRVGILARLTCTSSFFGDHVRQNSNKKPQTKINLSARTRPTEQCFLLPSWPAPCPWRAPAPGLLARRSLTERNDKILICRLIRARLKDTGG